MNTLKANELRYTQPTFDWVQSYSKSSSIEGDLGNEFVYHGEGWYLTDTDVLYIEKRFNKTSLHLTYNVYCWNGKLEDDDLPPTMKVVSDLRSEAHQTQNNIH